MTNDFFIDSKKLSAKALERKHQIENDASCRTNHMEYMPGMERIDSDILDNVIDTMNDYDYDRYTAGDVEAALGHEVCTIEDLKALLSPAAEPYLERMAAKIGRASCRERV